MTAATAIPDRPVAPTILADVQAVAEALEAGRPVDPAVASRIQERSAEARKQLLAARGVQSVGVDLIRDLRGDLPNP